MMDIPIESKWLRSAIRYSLSTVSYTSPLDRPGPPEQLDPRFRKIVEGIHYSRSFILTYHLIILCVVISFTSLHWLGKVRVWRRARRSQTKVVRDGATYNGNTCVKFFQDEDHPTDLDIGSSSDNSISDGTEDVTFGIKVIDEQTTLLNDCHSRRPLHSQKSLIGLIRAFLIYQPRPIPVVNKVLPSNAYTIIIVGFIALNVFYTFFQIKFNILELFVFADRCGLVFAANLPLLYILAAKTQPLKFLTGYSYESLNIIHRRLGEVLCLEALFHSVGMIVVWYTLLRPTGFTLTRFLLNKVILTGIASFITYETLYFASLASFRRRWYELFLGLHVFLQGMALALLFFHHHNSRIYVGIALGIFLIDRLIYRIGRKSVTFKASAKIMEDGETVIVSANFPLQSNGMISRFLGRNITGGWQASDHVFLSVPSLGLKHMVQAHPFTIKSTAPTAEDTNAKLELLVRAQRGFSFDLLREAMQRSSFTIRIDGPYGSSHCRSLLESSDLSMLVAGGSGIAVVWPLVDFLLQQNSPREVILVWVVHRKQHISWIGRPTLRNISNRGVKVVIPTATEEVGRPDLRAIMQALIPEDNHGRRVAIVGSGPDSMGRTVRNTCAEMVGRAWNVGVIIEKFGW